MSKLRLTAAIAVLLLTFVSSRLTIASILVGVVECCCGEHEADHECGCPDCPAASGKQKQQGEHESELPPVPSFETCGVQGSYIAALVTADFLLPRPGAAPLPRAMEHPDGPRLHTLVSTSAAPPTPPPEHLL